MGYIAHVQGPYGYKKIKFRLNHTQPVPFKKLSPHRGLFSLSVSVIFCIEKAANPFSLMVCGVPGGN